ncbi:hypothetical protein Clacol_003393 [Clathrus columnatus]|uniref:Uncharacterized protein n=1 Tax=Clathrus columnatus TaxID=1419009 RepID=A0AAV5A9E3_9AGAM|nr:hypothetical protein Clacol_003393 [Clathrus columnatus]
MSWNTLWNKPIHTMFTAPPIPAAFHYRESYTDEDSNHACMNMAGTVTVISPPDTVIVPLVIPDSIPIHGCENYNQDVVPMSQFTVLPQFTYKSQSIPIETWSENWKNLLQRYSSGQLARHTWDWEGTQLVPYYDLQSVKTLEDIWKEFTEACTLTNEYSSKLMAAVEVESTRNV